MTNLHKPSKALNITLWIVQAVLAASFFWGACMKLFMPVNELSAMWPWAGQIPRVLVKITGIVDLTGAIGLIVPSLLRIKPVLTPISAIAIIALMICASLFHIARDETSQIGANIIFAMMAAFIAWGRLKKAPVISTR